MKPPFLLLARSKNTPDPDTPWWALFGEGFSSQLILYLHAPREWAEALYGEDFDAYEACFWKMTQLDHGSVYVVWVNLEGDGSFNDAAMVHECVHLADRLMETQGFEGTEFRATCVECVVSKVWATRNETGYTPNAPVPDAWKELVQDLRKIENGR